MAYQVLSLKWRPKTFSDVVGQEHVTQTLTNAFSKKRLAQAYLFTGPRGVGKTTTARILAAALNCQTNSDGLPCNQCSNCREIADSRNMDVLEIDGASNRGIEEIRNLREMIRYTPINSRYKIFIIDEVHMLTGPAFNALLKTLEEPPEHGKFILATTDVHKVPPTIISRCQRYDFNRITVAMISAQLEKVLESEKIGYDRDSLQAVARKADGSMRDGLSFLDQVIAFCGDTITYQEAIKVLGIIPFDLHFDLSEAIRVRDTVTAVERLNEIQASGVPVVDFVNGFSQHIRNLLFATVAQGSGLVDLSAELKQRYLDNAPDWDRRDLLRSATLLMELEQTIRRTTHPYLALEILFLKLLEMDTSVSLDTLLADLAGSGKSAAVPPVVRPKPVPTPAPPAIPADRPVASDRTRDVRPENKTVPEQSAAVSQQQPTTVKLDLETIQTHWPGIITQIGRISASLGTVLEQSRPLEIQDNRLIIGVNGQPKFTLSRLESKQNEIIAVIEKFVKSPVRVQFLNLEGPAPVQEPVAEENNSNQAARGEAVIDRIVELFEGEQLR
ncbi:MAG: DNA polymerase III subunit gamma/tau [Candidatus Neomarinimicrobiota bacterium]